MKRYQRDNRINNNINIVPYLDVLLVLLIIFMVTAQSINAGIINLPSVAKSSQINTAPIIISITSSHYLLDGQQYNSMKEILVALNNVANSRTRLISVAADKNIKYDYVIKTLDELYRQNYRKVSLLVDQKA